MELFLLVWVLTTSSFILGVVFAVFVMKPKQNVMVSSDFGKPGFEQLFYNGVPIVVDPTKKDDILEVHKKDGSIEEIDITGIKKDPSIGVVRRPNKEQVDRKKNPKRTEEEAEVEAAFDELLGEK